MMEDRPTSVGHLLIAANQHEGGDINRQEAVGNNGKDGSGEKEYDKPLYNAQDESYNDHFEKNGRINENPPI